MYEIYDTKAQMALRPRYAKLCKAQRMADILDQEYGAVRYIVRRI